MVFFFSFLLLLIAAMLPQVLGFLAFFGIIILWWARLNWQHFSLWSSALCSGHIWWIALLSYRHMEAPLSGALLLFLVLSAWFAVVSCLYWYAAKTTLNRITLSILLCGYFFCIGIATPFLNGIQGYPFLNPALPIIAWLQPGSVVRSHQWTSWGEQDIYYLPTQKSQHRVECGQKLMLALNNVPPRAGVIISPESTFPYALNQTSEELLWWRSVLPEGSSWLMGAVWQQNNQSSQAAILLTNRPIINKQIKHNCIDFFESTNKTSILTQVMNKLIGWKTEDLTPGSLNVSNVLLLKEKGARVLLCSEALYAQLSDHTIVLANETWFMTWVQELFFAAIIWRAWWQQIHILIVAHHKAITY